MKRQNWIWMPHAGHLCVSNFCRFHLNTYVGGYIVSTVGEYVPDEGVREILASSRRIKLEGQGDARLADWMKKNGYEDLGLNGKYETMVFQARRSGRGHECCPWEQSGSDKDGERYMTAVEAFSGHVKYCLKWSKK